MAPSGELLKAFLKRAAFTAYFEAAFFAAFFRESCFVAFFGGGCLAAFFRGGCFATFLEGWLEQPLRLLHIKTITGFSVLRYLVATCEFGNLEDDIIRDRIVLGIYDDNLRARLLRKDELTLTQTIDFCRSFEQVRYT